MAAANWPGLAVTNSRFSLDGREQLVHAEVRQIDVDVVLAGKRIRRAFRDAYHLEFVAVDIDPFADGVFAIEQGSRDVGADHGHRHAVLIFDVGEEAPFRDFDLAASA